MIDYSVYRRINEEGSKERKEGKQGGKLERKGDRKEVRQEL